MREILATAGVARAAPALPSRRPSGPRAKRRGAASVLRLAVELFEVPRQGRGHDLGLRAPGAPGVCGELFPDSGRKRQNEIHVLSVHPRRRSVKSELRYSYDRVSNPSGSLSVAGGERPRQRGEKTGLDDARPAPV